MAREEKVLAFNFHSSTFISIHEYVNPTVPVASCDVGSHWEVSALSGEEKKPTPFRSVGQRMCVCEPQTDAPVYL